jgi:integrase
MNITLKSWIKYKELVTNYYIERKFSNSTIGRCNHFFIYCNKYFAIKPILTEQEIHYYYAFDFPNRDLKTYFTFLNKVIYYDKNNEFSNTLWRYWDVKEPLPVELRKVIDNYIQIESTTTTKRTHTIRYEKISGETFFTYIKHLGKDNLVDITLDDVISLFLNDDQEIIYSASFCKNIKAVLRANLKANNINTKEIKKIISFLPTLNSYRKNIQYLEDWEVKSIQDCLLNKKSDLLKRDRAIGLIILFYGIRGCDVANLHLNSIDWEKETISFIQQKTGIENILKFNNAVGNSVYDYIKNERPLSHSKMLFLRSNKPYNPILSTYNISVKIMKACNIRQKTGARQGFHLFRYKLASQMLGKNIPIPIISSILGHSNPQSTEIYLSTDFIHLKECGLDISIFSNSVKKENI